MGSLSPVDGTSVLGTIGALCKPLWILILSALLRLSFLLDFLIFKLRVFLLFDVCHLHTQILQGWVMVHLSPTQRHSDQIPEVAGASHCFDHKVLEAPLKPHYLVTL